MSTKEVIHRSELTPKNLKPLFATIASIYNRTVKNRKGMIRVIFSEDSKGIDIKLRIPTVNLSNSLKVLIKLSISKFAAKDNYLKLRDEEF